jgi:hypothetical protein
MPNQIPNTFMRSISAALLGNTAQKVDLDARFDKALKGPRRFHVREEFSGGEWDGAAGLIGTDTG